MTITTMVSIIINHMLNLTTTSSSSTTTTTTTTGCVYNQNVREMIQQTNGLHLVKEDEFAAGFFRSFVGQKA
jgi:hypothetical protein